jgi:hypothetical protein
VLKSWSFWKVPTAPSKILEVEDDKTHKKMVTNPAYSEWIVRDQQVLRYLLNSMSPDVLAHTVGLEHASEVRTAIGNLFAAPSSARITMLRGALSNTKKLDMTALKDLDIFFSVAMSTAVVFKCEHNGWDRIYSSIVSYA